ncbi:POGLUT2, partial [Symbiodinium necroappetens]
WWDHQMPWQSFFTVCEMVAPEIDLAFIGVVREGQVLYHCCSSECESPPLLKEPPVTDVEALLSLVAEVAEELPEMVFLFNTGDQPFVDKVYWSPIPQFHWVRSAGHWTIPLPNPYHLRAHAQHLLGDFPQHRDHHMPWAKKIPKIYWRGQLSAPDHFLKEDMGTLPRVRLMKLAKDFPDLFDVGITSVDREMYRTIGKAGAKQLVKQLGGEARYEKLRKIMPRYRYLINVAAVLSAWRLAEMLATGSLILMQDSADREVILEWLTPWVHYVPISQGLSDLVPKVKWLEDHQEEAEAIARRGFEHFSQRVRRHDTLCYLWQAFQAVANSQTRATSSELLPRTAGWKEVKPQLVMRGVDSYSHLKDLVASNHSEL